MVVALGFIVLIGLFAAPISPLSWHSPAAVEANSPPEFSSATTTREVNENTPSFRNIGIPVTATDGDNDRLTYSLENASKSHFAIKSSTGQLLTGTPLDHEKGSRYTVKVKATDPSGDSDTITVTIEVKNLDESGSVWLYWNQPQVGTDLKAELSDLDGVTYGTVTWVWERSSNRRDWDEISGAASNSYTPGDTNPTDVGKYLRATASYTDGHGSDKTARAVSSRSVRQPPSDNNPPAFETETADRTLKTNSHPGTEINNSFYAKDDDQGDEVRYTLVDATDDPEDFDDSQFFGIGPVNGRLYTKFQHRRGHQGTDSSYKGLC